MRKLLLLAVLSSSTAFALDSKDLEVSGYMRAGVGENDQGGDQTCFQNKGRGEFRLGNECANYGELTFKFNHLKGKSASDKYAFTQLTLKYEPPGSAQYEDSSLQIIEGFAQIGNIFSRPISAWAGKRHYREQDIYLNDMWYFAQMSGNGAGFSAKTDNGEFKYAMMRQVSTTTTNVGKYGINIYDFRFNNVSIAKDHTLNFWLAIENAPKASTSTVQYDNSQGQNLGVLLRSNLSGGFNHFSVEAGHGLGKKFGIYIDPVSKGSPTKGAVSYRVINHSSIDLNKEISAQLALVHETVKYPNSINNVWNSVGFSPMYKFNDDFRINSLFAYSMVDEERVKPTMYRVTIAPEITVNDSIWGRPVLRMFYSYSGWNQDGKASKDAPYNTKDGGSNIGFQAEVIF